LAGENLLFSQTHSFTASCYRKLQHTTCHTQTELSALCIYISPRKTVRLMKLGLRTPGGTTWFPYPRTQPPLHIPRARYRTPPDINIFAFCQFDALTISFLKLDINSCFYYVSYDIFNILQGRASLACKKNPCSQQHHLPVHTIKFSHFHLSKLPQLFKLRFPVMLIGSQVSI
jgi:hypothetical protein